ncbi:uncharacterized protein BJ171DRAFT_484468 [Polychytrium aggregatum]|uniref:uncharacterized protein n=1 Tax=Polychytrium aggregatum TaxID=110093 RepID=UPI0022FDDAAC|nr:uncharacterized protein BJ171DRAFT_484468 [Polychytrium aggregatum]KAI9209582.1 hypothetical protein BJ171DRAFT_484468 [Polychytrium aggregatum]
MEQVTALLKHLMQIESTTGNEGPVAVALGQYLQQRGWTVELQPVDADGKRRNVYAHRGDSRSKPVVLLNSHIDTVPPYIPFSEDSDKIYGRGSCDAKGSIASQVVAVSQLIEEGKLADGDVALLYVVGEETDHAGMIKANELGLDARFLIVGEPTESCLANGHKGIIKATVVCKGKAGHSGYPERGASAIEALVKILHDLQSNTWPVDERLGPTTINLGIVSGGVAANVIPEHAEAQISVRVSAQLQQIVERIRHGVQSHQVAGVDASVHFGGVLEPVRCETVELTGVDTFTAAYFTDIPFLKGNHLPLLIGPGSIKVAHSVDEHVEKKDLVQLVDIYKELILKLVARAKQ